MTICVMSLSFLELQDVVCQLKISSICENIVIMYEIQL